MRTPPDQPVPPAGAASTPVGSTPAPTEAQNNRQAGEPKTNRVSRLGLLLSLLPLLALALPIIRLLRDDSLARGWLEGPDAQARHSRFSQAIRDAEKAISNGN